MCEGKGGKGVGPAPTMKSVNCGRGGGVLALKAMKTHSLKLSTAPALTIKVLQRKTMLQLMRTQPILPSYQKMMMSEIIVY